ncbi:zinc-binding alcohol dehydrogenase/oxidoreductase [Alteribacillus persepolensis]|uniref:Zinc-binding alcohol dehydrogenase/oxidoreductase n=1 Tax=Alteribacillus persepolensis TaxID=568899 RepID=A0A1G7Z4A6_9BACI|nr:zinc-binding dehydrogenase [Alteribacillus persepolensis]SDH03543.1 zinc-binding alcohol dehydrogenase/oxidoreductase [Alteribacillus persepolensis]
MKAVVHEKQMGKAGLSLRQIEKKDPAQGEVTVKLKSAGLNHRDIFVLDRHKPEDPPVILGSDGAGVIESVGTGVQRVNVGDEVVINPGLGWEMNSDAPPEGFQILGFPDNGTFAEYLTVSADSVEKKPEHLNWEEAGVFSLAALTAYRALFTRGKIHSDMTVLIPGIGSGVATFLLQFAKAAGATVYVTSRSEAKREKALELGADLAIDSNDDWDKQLHGTQADLVIESVGAATFDQSLHQLRRGGTLVTFGASAGDTIQLDLRSFFYGQYNLLGSTMGSAEEYRDMLQLIESQQIRPVMDRTYTLEQFHKGFKRLEEAQQFGKVGFQISM